MSLVGMGLRAGQGSLGIVEHGGRTTDEETWTCKIVKGKRIELAFFVSFMLHSRLRLFLCKEERITK